MRCFKTNSKPLLFIHPLFPLLEGPSGSEGKESACSAGDLGSVSGLGRSPGEQNGYALQYSCLENSMDRGTWRFMSMGCARTHTHTHTHTHTLFPLQPCFSLTSALVLLFLPPKGSIGPCFFLCRL